MPFDDTTGFQVEDTTLNDLEVLRKVKASLSADHAWCRDAYYTGEARCLVGWMIFHIAGVKAPGGVPRVVHEFTRRTFGGTVCDLQTFNDTQRQVTKVVALVDRAITRLEAKL